MIYKHVYYKFTIKNMYTHTCTEKNPLSSMFVEGCYGNTNWDNYNIHYQHVFTIIACVYIIFCQV